MLSVRHSVIAAHPRCCQGGEAGGSCCRWKAETMRQPCLPAFQGLCHPARPQKRCALVSTHARARPRLQHGALTTQLSRVVKRQRVERQCADQARAVVFPHPCMALRIGSVVCSWVRTGSMFCLSKCQAADAMIHSLHGPHNGPEEQCIASSMHETPHTSRKVLDWALQPWCIWWVEDKTWSEWIHSTALVTQHPHLDKNTPQPLLGPATISRKRTHVAGGGLAQGTRGQVCGASLPGPPGVWGHAGHAVGGPEGHGAARGIPPYQPLCKAPQGGRVCRCAATLQYSCSVLPVARQLAQ